MNLSSRNERLAVCTSKRHFICDNCQPIRVETEPPGNRRAVLFVVTVSFQDHPHRIKRILPAVVIEALLNDALLQDVDVYLLKDSKKADAAETDRLKQYIRQVYDPMAKKSSLFAHEERYFSDSQYKRFIGNFSPMLERQLSEMGETFTEMLLRFIDRAGISDANCYKNSGISKQLFSKIRSDKNYQPKKKTVLSFAVGLRLSLADTKALLESAGYSLSNASKFGIIVKYYIGSGKYDLYEINEALDQHGQELHGGQ